jgi:hypothetical protein
MLKVILEKITRFKERANFATLAKLRTKAVIYPVINVIVATLFMTAVFGCIKLHRSNLWLASEKAVVAEKYTTLVDTHTTEVADLSATIKQQQHANEALQTANHDMETTIAQLEADITKLEEQLDVLYKSTVIGVQRRDFKSYMDYRTITNHLSDQWKLQLLATTDEDGIRCIDGVPLVAIGTGWGHWVGDRITIICENGNRFDAIVGDIKSNRHTDAANLTTVANGCRCEFIVDTSVLNNAVRVAGNAAVMSEYAGYVVGVVRAE